MSLPAGERNRRARWEGASEGNCANAALLSVLDVPLAAAISLDRAAWLIRVKDAARIATIIAAGRSLTADASHRASLPAGENNAARFHAPLSRWERRTQSASEGQSDWSTFLK
jgi:hypothetical protein